MPFLIIIGAIFAYIIAASFAFPYISSYCAAACNNCSKGQPYSYNYKTQNPGFGHNEAYALSAIWPVVLPFIYAQRNDPRIVLGKARIDEFWKNETANALEKGTHR